MITTWKMGYRRARKRAEKIYFKIGTIQCPALNDEVIFF